MRLSGAGWPHASYLAGESATAIAEWYRLVCLQNAGCRRARAILHDHQRRTVLGLAHFPRKTPVLGLGGSISQAKPLQQQSDRIQAQSSLAPSRDFIRGK
jgi:hypothetical protein